MNDENFKYYYYNLNHSLMYHYLRHKHIYDSTYSERTKYERFRFCTLDIIEERTLYLNVLKLIGYMV